LAQAILAQAILRCCQARDCVMALVSDSARWIADALAGARLSGASGRHLRRLEHMVIEESRRDTRESSHWIENQNEGMIDEVAVLLAEASRVHCGARFRQPVHLQRALASCGHKDLAARVARRAKGRNAAAHPDPLLQQDVVAALSLARPEECDRDSVPIKTLEDDIATFAAKTTPVTGSTAAPDPCDERYGPCGLALASCDREEQIDADRIHTDQVMEKLLDMVIKKVLLRIDTMFSEDKFDERIHEMINAKVQGGLDDPQVEIIDKVFDVPVQKQVQEPRTSKVYDRENGTQVEISDTAIEVTENEDQPKQSGSDYQYEDYQEYEQGPQSGQGGAGGYQKYMDYQYVGEAAGSGKDYGGSRSGSDAPGARTDSESESDAEMRAVVAQTRAMRARLSARARAWLRRSSAAAAR